ncbi:hypothetical protein ACFLY6_02820 [Candidatus Dependentiae bacterium]
MKNIKKMLLALMMVMGAGAVQVRGAEDKTTDNQSTLEAAIALYNKILVDVDTDIQKKLEMVISGLTNARNASINVKEELRKDMEAIAVDIFSSCLKGSKDKMNYYSIYSDEGVLWTCDKCSRVNWLMHKYLENTCDRGNLKKHCIWCN